MHTHLRDGCEATESVLDVQQLPLGVESGGHALHEHSQLASLAPTA